MLKKIVLIALIFIFSGTLPVCSQEIIANNPLGFELANNRYDTISGEYALMTSGSVENLIKGGIIRSKMTGGVITNLKGGEIEEMRDNARITFMKSGSIIRSMIGGRIDAFHGGNIEHIGGGSIGEVHDDLINIYALTIDSNIYADLFIQNGGYLILNPFDGNRKIVGNIHNGGTIYLGGYNIDSEYSIKMQDNSKLIINHDKIFIPNLIIEGTKAVVTFNSGNVTLRAVIDNLTINRIMAFDMTVDYTLGRSDNIIINKVSENSVKENVIRIVKTTGIKGKVSERINLLQDNSGKLVFTFPNNIKTVLIDGIRYILEKDEHNIWYIKLAN